MKQAVVTGATGYIGSAVVSELLNNDIAVLAIGRRPQEEVRQPRLSGQDTFRYLQLDAANICSLPELAEGIDWKLSDQCVFYNFAWSGVNGLTDGEIEDQLKNVSYCADAVVAAKALGCQRFVNSGTLEETFLERRLESDWQKDHHNTQQELYAVSKLSARDMCKLVAYLQKIEYVHTRFSAFLDEELTGDGYIPATLRKIANGEAYDKPRNDQLFDLLPLTDGARAYYLIGKHGVNKADYFIGSGEPQTLEAYLSRFEALAKGISYSEERSSPLSDGILEIEDFTIAELERDTGFSVNVSFDKFSRNVLEKL